MLYACLKAIHLLSMIVWLGGMFFVVACLRPALAAIEPAARLRLMQQALGRFFGLAGIAIVVMLAIASRASTSRGLAFNMPIDWDTMIVLGLLMIAIHGHLWVALFQRLARAADAQDDSAGAAALVRIRHWVLLNLTIGAAVVVVMRLGASG